VANAIKQGLQSHGIRCWKAPDDIFPGESWPAAITRAISICKAMVLVWSSNSIGSHEVSKELTLAMTKGLMVIPYKIENIPPNGEWEYHLANSHWLDVCGDQELLAVSKLSEHLMHIFKRQPVSEPPSIKGTPALLTGMDEWTELYWWLNRGKSLKSLDQKKLDALQQKLEIPDDFVASKKQSFSRNLEEFQDILNQALEDGVLEQDEADAVELTRKQCCISNKEVKALFDELPCHEILVSADCSFGWLPAPPVVKADTTQNTSPTLPSATQGSVQEAKPVPEQQSKPSTPSPKKEDFSQKLEVLFAEMKMNLHSDGLFWEPAIPAKKLNNARKSYGIPSDEQVFALVDATIFGSADNGLALCRGGIYLHNDWTAWRPGSFFVPWTNVGGEEVMPPGKRTNEFHVGNGVFCDLSGSRVTTEFLECLVEQVIDALRAN